MRYDLSLPHVLLALLAWAVFFGGWLVRRWWRQAKAEDAEAIAAQQCADLGPPQE